MDKRFTTLDLGLSSFISTHGIPPTIEVTNKRAIFVFPASDEVYKLVLAYNMNTPTPILDYLTSYKNLRSEMLTARGPK
jgi:hypothetical protein